MTKAKTLPIGSIYPTLIAKESKVSKILESSRAAHIFSALRNPVAARAKPRPSSLIWGKSSSLGAHDHCALAAHSLAVGACFFAILDVPGVRKSLEAALGGSKLPVSLLIWAASLHDLGKSHYLFQQKDSAIMSWLSKRFELPVLPQTPAIENFDHGNHGGRRIWPSVFDAMVKEGYFKVEQECSRSNRNLRGIMYAAFAHHGEHGKAEELHSDPHEMHLAGIELALGIAKAITEKHGEFEAIESIKSPVVFAQIFAGWVAVADWIASNPNTFEYINCEDFSHNFDDPKNWEFLYAIYVSLSRQEIEKLGIVKAPETQFWEKSVMGPHTCNQVQKSMLVAAQKLSYEEEPGGLIILEAQMGVGKTEAALLACGGWISSGMCQGVAFGLPAQASANMMLRRMDALSSAVYGVQPNLAHANSALIKSAIRKGCETGKGNAGLLLSRWISDQNKKAFLAPVTASTVDQMELAVMQSKHGFVRFASLSRQAVVIDEVHAYDAYMQHIIRNLLVALGAAQVPVILLSATLPVYQRAAFCNAYAQGAGWQPQRDSSNDNAYPLLTYVAKDAGWASIPIAWEEPDKKVLIESYHVEMVLEKILEQTSKGRCVALILNTKRSARLWYLLLRRYTLNNPLRNKSFEVNLIHASFRMQDRLNKQEKIEGILGPNSNFAQRRGQVIVSTQILEQSIDIDVDYMISEPAPADLLLQRMGRLFRHKRSWRRYQPRFAVLIPRVRDHKYGDRWYRTSVSKIYAESGKLDESLDLFTKISMQSKRDDRCIKLPSQIPSIIANVYGNSETAIMNTAQVIQDKKASKVSLKLQNQIDNIAADTLISDETRNIEVEIEHVLITHRDKVSGKLFIPTQEGLIELPDIYSRDKKRMNSRFLEIAQKWVTNIKKKSANDDPDYMFRRLNSYREALKNAKSYDEAIDPPQLPFLIIQCEEVIETRGHVRMFMGTSDAARRVYYDSEVGLNY